MLPELIRISMLKSYRKLLQCNKALQAPVTGMMIQLIGLDSSSNMQLELRSTDLEQRLANYSFWAQSGPLPIVLHSSQAKNSFVLFRFSILKS